MTRRVDAAFLAWLDAVDSPGANQQSQVSSYLVVDRRDVYVAGAHGSEQFVTHVSRGSGHFEIEAGVRRSDGVVRSTPIGDHDTVEAPLSLQHVSQQFAMGARVGAIYPVVR